MEAKLEWRNEEEGTITFSGDTNRFLTVQFFVTGEEEAEFRVQDIVFSKDEAENVDMQQKITSEMIKCIFECFRLLWNEGLKETILVEQKGSKMAKILDSTSVVRHIYSEYMMKRRFEPQKSTFCGLKDLKLTKEEGGYRCENAEKTFFCRLLPYEAEQPEESSFYLYEVKVNQKLRNKGIATACLTQLFQLLAGERSVTIYLQVGSYNEPAVHLYEKLGFTVSEELCFYAPED